MEKKEIHTVNFNCHDIFIIAHRSYKMIIAYAMVLGSDMVGREVVPLGYHMTAIPASHWFKLIANEMKTYK